MYTCKFLDWKSGDLPKSEVYKPKMTAKHYGKEELTSRQKRQVDTMAGLNPPIHEPLPSYDYRQSNVPTRSEYDIMHERIGAPLFYNKNRRK